MRFQLLNFIAFQAHHSIYLFDGGDSDLEEPSRESPSGSIFYYFRWVSFIISEGDNIQFYGIFITPNQAFRNALARDIACDCYDFHSENSIECQKTSHAAA
jgi:hypothetical protein